MTLKDTCDLPMPLCPKPDLVLMRLTGRGRAGAPPTIPKGCAWVLCVSWYGDSSPMGLCLTLPSCPHLLRTVSLKRSGPALCLPVLHLVNGGVADSGC